MAQFLKGAGSRLVSTAAELASDFVAIHVTAAAETQLKATTNLADEDHSSLGSLHGQGEINCVLGVTRFGTGHSEVLFLHVGVHQRSI